MKLADPKKSEKLQEIAAEYSKIFTETFKDCL